MGAYLSRPIFEPESSSGSGRGLSFGASSVQGWRMSQEDAHNCIIDYDDDCSLFAVYDGHGGSEVSKYCSLHLPTFIKTLGSYKAGDFKQALIDAFLEFDRTLTKPETIEVLKQLAQFDSADEGDEDEVREETDELRKEANMPLDEILKIYKKAADIMKAKKKEKEEKKAKNGNDDDKEDEDSKDEDAAETNNEDGNEAAAVVPDLKEEGDQEPKSEEAKTSEKSGEKNGVSQKPEKEPKEAEKPCAAGSSSEEVAPSASNAEKSQEAPSGGRGGRAAAQRARRIITDEEINNNNDEDGDDDDDSESSSEEDSEDQNMDDDDEEEEDDDEDEESSEEEDDEDEDPLRSDGIEVFDSDVPGSGSGSTAVVALLKGNRLTVANAGDSRAIICRSGKAIDMSIDHKPEDAIERMRIERAGGKITADGRVNRGLNLSRAIGDHAYKQNKQLTLAEQMISSLPDVQTIVIDRQTDDFLILACDGIWNCMTSQEVCDFVTACHRQGDKLTDICEQLFRRCIAPDTTGDGTGCDNMTCIIVRLSEEPSIGGKRPSEEGSEENKAKKSRNEEDNTAAEEGTKGSSVSQ